VHAACIGHPLADELDARDPAAKARAELGLAGKKPIMAVLPGSRSSELKYLAEPFAQAAARLYQSVPNLQCVVPIARPDLKPWFEQAAARHPGPRWTLLDGQSRQAMRAADVVLLASGTATLECLLLGRPMVVAYKTSALTEFLVLKLLKIPYVSLPNILSAAPVVPELLGRQATVERLAREVGQLLRHAVLRDLQVERFAAVHRELRRDAGALAAVAIGSLLGR
jgi:lipid-A-disaccharide synthase